MQCHRRRPQKSKLTLMTTDSDSTQCKVKQAEAESRVASKQHFNMPCSHQSNKCSSSSALPPNDNGDNSHALPMDLASCTLLRLKGKHSKVVVITTLFECSNEMRPCFMLSTYFLRLLEACCNVLPPPCCTGA